MLFSRRAPLVAFAFTTFAIASSRHGFATSTAGAPDRVTAALVAKPVALPDMALGSDTAPITIVEYSSLTCPHCAAFAENVFPMLQSKYIDTGKVRFVSRDFPLDFKAAAASMLARCAAKGEASKFFEATMMLFKQQQDLVEHTTDTLTSIGAKFGMAQSEVEKCVKNDDTLDKLQAAQTFAHNQLKVEATPTFFINGEKLQGSMSFEELEAKLLPLLKR
ncbi:MAG TPA: DsbA family protein [Bradyrhizobium sp.]|uniref:DsbA family protein n=1 Tax=Bradyrhizobium sp. TaxID=376 RepID=UPI002BD110FE|nr:DsbA family protein [Bradyrhizobium sp.]HLZ01403.1 DsbA family protein [Bradyrhizobium sp.]